MDGHFILKSDYPQVAAPQLRYKAPEPVSVVLLRLGSKWIVENANAPFFLDVWPFSENFSLEILGEVVLGHWTDYRS